jgi:hypothetical protein
MAKGESTIVWEIESYEKAIIFIEEQKLSCMALCGHRKKAGGRKGTATTNVRQWS